MITLKTEKMPPDHEWLVGRPSSDPTARYPDVPLFDATISREHAWIRCSQEHGRDQWQIKPTGTNRTIMNDLVLDKERWINITGWDDILIFGDHGVGFCASKYDDTAPGDDELSDQGEETVNATMEAAIAQAKAEQIQIDNPWEALYYGLKDIPNSRLAIYALFTLGALAAWLAAEVLKHLND